MPLVVGQSQASSLAFWIGTIWFFGLLPWSRRGKAVRYVWAATPVITIVLCTLLGGFNGVRGVVNWLCEPQRLFPLAGMALVMALVFYRGWTRPRVAWPLLGLAGAAYLACAFDEHFRPMVTRPDNVPITLLILGVTFFVWLGLRRTAINDRRSERGEPLAEEPSDQKVMTWPDLLLAELVLMIAATAGLIVWAILVRAPLEPPANPQVVPNPAKAPWYFVGLQELLTYFDPWLAGVFLPGLTIFGLCAIPYLDRNAAGNGYYTLRERPLAVATFLCGFLLLWVLPIVMGTFLRGPNWSFFGPFEPWDPLRSSPLVNVNLSEWFWAHGLGRVVPGPAVRALAGHCLLREAPGLVLLAGYFVGLPVLLKATWFKQVYRQMGAVRYGVFTFLLTWMGLVPIKMLLRWLFDLKYILAITEWSFNI